MFKRKNAARDNVADQPSKSGIKDVPKAETIRVEGSDVNLSWNSWGDRNPLSFGSFGRW
ncbi:hypothetical protein [Teichococcus globiformis]|uniref:hypothetical protein n=1 Tax=Teichococcus globiformis TaxID=2307229 RepID=UPI0036D43063